MVRAGTPFRTAAGRRSPHSVSGDTAASVSTTDNIVAIRGWIMPTPFAMPLTVTLAVCPSASAPGSETVIVATFRPPKA